MAVPFDQPLAVVALDERADHLARLLQRVEVMEGAGPDTSKTIHLVYAEYRGMSGRVQRFEYELRKRDGKWVVAEQQEVGGLTLYVGGLGAVSGAVIGLVAGQVRGAWHRVSIQ